MLDGWGEGDGASLNAISWPSPSVPPRPDLVLIHGGAGQLAVASEVRADLGVDDIAVVGVAKGPDR